jgi:hypothetical protein
LAKFLVAGQRQQFRDFSTFFGISGFDANKEREMSIQNENGAYAEPIGIDPKVANVSYAQQNHLPS